MHRLPFIAPRAGRFVVGVLFSLKILLLAWNAIVFDTRGYDHTHHADRALFGGLRVSKMAYNPPPYYLPALLLPRPADVPLIERNPETAGDDEEAVQAREERRVPTTASERRHRAALLALLRYTNVLYVGAFYWLWIYFSFPRLLPGPGAWFLASVLLLALPGYQKLGVMTHPDNLFAATSAACAAGWLGLRERWTRRSAGVDTNGVGFWHLAWLALAIGAAGLTRPFAIVPVLVFSGVLVVYVRRLEGPTIAWPRMLLRAGALLTVIGALSLGWYVYRWSRSGEVTNAYKTAYMARFEKHKKDFDFVGYFTRFRLGDLLENPNRQMAKDKDRPIPDNPRANTFFTLLYSEFWGDHWLHFSGPAKKETKLWPKRVVLTTALAVPFVLLWALVQRSRDIWKNARATLGKVGARPFVSRALELGTVFEREIVLLGLAGFGAALFVYWQTGPALLPGKNSTIKFIYVATFVPPGIALLFGRRMQPLTFNVLAAYFLTLFIAAFPVAMFWPNY